MIPIDQTELESSVYFSLKSIESNCLFRLVACSIQFGTETSKILINEKKIRFRSADLFELSASSH